MKIYRYVLMMILAVAIGGTTTFVASDVQADEGMGTGKPGTAAPTPKPKPGPNP